MRKKAQLTITIGFDKSSWSWKMYEGLLVICEELSYGRRKGKQLSEEKQWKIVGRLQRAFLYCANRPDAMYVV